MAPATPLIGEPGLLLRARPLCSRLPSPRMPHLVLRLLGLRDSRLRVRNQSPEQRNHALASRVRDAENTYP